MVNKALEKVKQKLQRRKTKKRKKRAKKAAKNARKKRRIRNNDPDSLGEKARAAGYQARQIGGELGVTTDRAKSVASSAADAFEPPSSGNRSREPSLPDFGGVQQFSGGSNPTPRVPETIFAGGGGGASGSGQPRVPETVLEMGGEGYGEEPYVPETVFGGDGRDQPPMF